MLFAFLSVFTLFREAIFCGLNVISFFAGIVLCGQFPVLLPEFLRRYPVLFPKQQVKILSGIDANLLIQIADVDIGRLQQEFSRAHPYIGEILPNGAFHLLFEDALHIGFIEPHMIGNVVDAGNVAVILLDVVLNGIDVADEVAVGALINPRNVDEHFVDDNIGIARTVLVLKFIQYGFDGGVNAVRIRDDGNAAKGMDKLFQIGIALNQ